MSAPSIALTAFAILDFSCGVPGIALSLRWVWFGGFSISATRSFIALRILELFLPLFEYTDRFWFKYSLALEALKPPLFVFSAKIARAFVVDIEPMFASSHAAT